MIHKTLIALALAAEPKLIVADEPTGLVGGLVKAVAGQRVGHAGFAAVEARPSERLVEDERAGDLQVIVFAALGRRVVGR